jgi:hypothetical protein
VLTFGDHESALERDVVPPERGREGGDLLVQFQPNLVERIRRVGDRHE